MTTQTFIFESDSSESECIYPENEDKAFLLKPPIRNQYDEGEGHSRKSPSYKVSTTHDNNNETNHNSSPLSGNQSKKNYKIKSINDGIKQLEKNELDKKKFKIHYQLMLTSAVAMLHGLSITPFFWNLVFLNVDSLQTQTVYMWCFLISYSISCLISPFIVHRFSLKTILSVGCIAGSVFIASRFYPKVYLVAPASVMLGLTLAPFYTVIHSHICNLSIQNEGYHGATYKQSIYRFTAILYGWMSCSPLWLSLLHTVIYNLIGGEYKNDIVTATEDCGFEYIWNPANAFGLSPEFHSVQALLASSLVCTLGGLLLTRLALEEYVVPYHTHSASIGEKIKEEISANFAQMKTSNFMLMVPLFFGLGMIELFCYTVYEQAYVACNFGSDSKFYIAMCVAACSALASIPSSFAYPRLSSTVKVALPAYGFMLAFLSVIAFGNYMPYAMLFVMAALIGVTNYIITSQIMVLVLFHSGSKTEVSYSFLQLSRVSAYLVTFILIRYQGDNSNIIVCIFGALAMCVFCHAILEVRVKLLEKQDGGGSDKAGAYILLSQEAPWIPDIDPTTVNKKKTKKLCHRLPAQEEFEQSDIKK